MFQRGERFRLSHFSGQEYFSDQKHDFSENNRKNIISKKTRKLQFFDFDQFKISKKAKTCGF